ncbi:MAG: molybdenum cofactor guanylyltransferase [Solirubrobacteraceae bacterium]
MTREQVPVGRDGLRTTLVAVLAGGRGSRLAGAKPGTELAGRPLIAYPIMAARAAGLGVLVVAKRQTPLPALDCEILVEPDEPRHPLCGVIAALAHHGAPVVVIACDMPLVPAPLLALLASCPGPAAVALDGRPEPLLARYEPGQLAQLELAVRERRAAHTVLADQATVLIGERDLAAFGDPVSICMNVNDARDLAEAERLLAQRVQTGRKRLR